MRLLLPFLLLSPLTSSATEEPEDQYFFPIEPAPEDFVNTATWIFDSDLLLPIPLEECWDIITDDGAWEFWHPEVTHITNTEGFPGTIGSKRTIVYKDWLLNTLSLGAITFEETFDVWEDDGEYRRYSFYFSGATRDESFTWTMAREELICVKVDEQSSRFGRTVAIEPGVGQQTLSFLVRPWMARTFEKLCPKRLLDAIEAGDLPRKRSDEDEDE